jgi:hypothetical protein
MVRKPVQQKTTKKPRRMRPGQGEFGVESPRRTEASALRKALSLLEAG